MKGFFILSLLLILLLPAQAQTFVTVPSDSVYTTLDPNSSADLMIYWRNTSNQTISLDYQEIIASYPLGWVVQIMDDNLSWLMPHSQGSSLPFAPGDSSFLKIVVIPFGIPGFGLFCYEITDTVAGYSTSMCMSFDAQLTSTIASSMEEAVQIFPNPADGTLRLSAQGQRLMKGKVELLKADGTILKQWTVYPESFQEWDVSTLAAGIYRMTYTTATERISRNLIIAR